ncbi:MAG TPA: alpha/beta fold hydrolase [Streptosporangiaceae bacterium]|jgi:pimeloyl-ACP methyl ester carboxylesterase
MTDAYDWVRDAADDAGGLDLLLTGAELGKIVAGRSSLAPDRKDRRFADPAWTGNPLLKRTVRAYLAACAAAGALYGGSARLDPARIADTTHAGNRAGSPLGYLYQLSAGTGWTSLPFLPLLRQQTLILAGDDDPLIPLANARLMHRLIPHSTLHVYHGGHLGMVTEAKEIAPVVDGFLREETS